jgi:hypothetical protein
MFSPRGLGSGVAIFTGGGNVGLTYYVSATGNNANDGLSTSAPKQTIAAVNALTLNAGDTVAFKGGDTFNDATLVAVSGVTYTSYGTGKATLSPPNGSSAVINATVDVFTLSNVIISGSSTKGGIETNWASGSATSFTLQNVEISGAFKHSVDLYGHSGFGMLGTLTVDGCAFHGATNNGLAGYFETTTASPCGITTTNVTNSSFYSNGDTGLKVGSWSTTGFAYNLTTFNITDCTAYSNGYSGFIVYGQSGGTWERLKAYSNGASTGGGVGIFPWMSKNVVVRNCESYNNTSPNTVDGDGFDLEGCDDCIIERCYSHGNKGAGFFMYDYVGSPGNNRNTIRYCISENDGTNTTYGGIVLWSANSVAISNARVYNNTVYNNISGGACLKLLNGVTLTGFVANNIFVASGSANQVATSGSPAITVDKNVWYGGSGSGYGTNKITTDPLLVNPGAGVTWGYLIQPGSPAQSAGVDIASTYSVSIGTKDFFGTTLGSPPLNLGAYSGVAVTDLGIPAQAYQVDPYPRQPWFIKAWDGKVYIANGNASNSTPSPNSGCKIISYNPATNTVTNEYTASDEQISTFREIGGQLWAAGGDKDGGGNNDWLYKYVNGSWSKYEVLPFAEHGFDLIEFGGNIWASGGTNSPPTAYSSDNGATWTQVSMPTGGIPPVRTHILFTFGGNLFVSGNLDGSWQYTPPSTYVGGLYPYKLVSGAWVRQSNITPNATSDQIMMHRAEELSGKLIYISGAYRNQIQISPEQMYVATSGFASITQPTLDSGEIPYDLKQYSGTVYVLTGKPDGSGNYTVRIRTTTDAASFPVLFEFTAPSWGLSFDILNGDFYIGLGTTNGTISTTGPSTVNPDTGRLYRVQL